MNKQQSLRQFIGLGALALMLGATPVHAQKTDANTARDRTEGTTKGPSSEKAGQFSHDDKEMMEDIAHANLAEIEVGKIALDKSKSDQVRKFAQTLIDDHTKAMKELDTLAQSKGASLPAETDLEHKAIATALKVLTGVTFDKEFISRVGIKDHQRTHDLLQKTISKAEDKDLKAYAQKAIKVVDHHLSTAKKLEGQIESKK